MKQPRGVPSRIIGGFKPSRETQSVPAAVGHQHPVPTACLGVKAEARSRSFQALRTRLVPQDMVLRQASIACRSRLLEVETISTLRPMTRLSNRGQGESRLPHNSPMSFTHVSSDTS